VAGGLHTQALPDRMPVLGNLRRGNSPEQILDLILAKQGYRARSRELDHRRKNLTCGLTDALCRRSRSVVESDPTEAFVLARLAIRATRHLGDPARERDALQLAARTGTGVGQFRDALRYLDAAAELAGTDRSIRAHIDAERVEALTHLDEHDEARAAALRALAWFGSFQERQGETRTRLASATHGGTHPPPGE